MLTYVCWRYKNGVRDFNLFAMGCDVIDFNLWEHIVEIVLADGLSLGFICIINDIRSFNSLL